MKEIRNIILSLKDKETLTKDELISKLTPEVEKELEKLMREGEIFFPKKNVITRIC